MSWLDLPCHGMPCKIKAFRKCYLYTRYTCDTIYFVCDNILLLTRIFICLYVVAVFTTLSLQTNSIDSPNEFCIFTTKNCAQSKIKHLALKKMTRVSFTSIQFHSLILCKLLFKHRQYESTLGGTRALTENTIPVYKTFDFLPQPHELNVKSQLFELSSLRFSTKDMSGKGRK